jgi:hypothetical protein
MILWFPTLLLLVVNCEEFLCLLGSVEIQRSGENDRDFVVVAGVTTHKDVYSRLLVWFQLADWS